MTVKITRADLTAEDLRREAALSDDANAARRMLAIALVMEGSNRQTAAKACGMDRQTLRDWVHRYNAEGIAGLSNRRSPGASCLLNPEQQEELAGIVRRGPDLDKDGVVRWRRVDLQRVIKERFDVTMHERTVSEYLRRLGFRRLSVRPQHPKADRAEQEAFKKNFCAKVKAVLPEAAQGKPLEIWFQDEARVGQKGTLTRVWAERGTRPRAPRDTRYSSAYIFGAACPERAATAAMIMPEANSFAMNVHLAEISKAVAEGAHAILVLDGASWHGSEELRVPENITTLKLPAYAPELNPMENVWQWLRANKLAISVFDSYSDIVDRCCTAWKDFAADSDVVRSVTSRDYAKTVNI